MPSQGIVKSTADDFNEKMRFEIDNIRDFIILHYHVTHRSDSQFWRYCKSMDIPKSLQKRLTLFSESAQAYKTDKELFGETSWIQVMMGQGVVPEQYHRVADEMSETELERFLAGLKQQVDKQVSALPYHQDFLKKYL